MRRLDGITRSVDMTWSKLKEVEKNREAWHAAVHGVAKGQATFLLLRTTEQKQSGTIPQALLFLMGILQE